uniref:Dynein heavy chain 1, axonemal-like n=2 Tax=Ciona intestinalis TaxID=7719 RepID=H2XKT8_CIOIN
MNGYPYGYDVGGTPSSRGPHPPRTASRSRKRVASAQLSQMSLRSRHTLMEGPPAKQSDICQRGHYSDIINPGADENLGNLLNGPEVQQDLLYKSLKKEHLPSVTTFNTPDETTYNSLVQRQQFGPTTELTTKTDFPTQAWQPKVQTPFYVPPGDPPRKIEIERGKRIYSKQRLSHLLTMEGIDSNKLMPKHYPDSHKVQLNKSPDPAPFPAFLPLEIFDNTEYDCRTPDEWLGLGVEDGVR